MRTGVIYEMLATDCELPADTYLCKVSETRQVGTCVIFPGVETPQIRDVTLGSKAFPSLRVARGWMRHVWHLDKVRVERVYSYTLASHLLFDWLLSE